MEENEKVGKVGKVLEIISVIGIITYISWMFFLFGLRADSTSFSEALVGDDRDVVSVVYKKTGCSLLVEDKDGSRYWVWVPKIPGQVRK